MVVAFYFRLHLAYFPRPVVAIFARPEQQEDNIEIVWNADVRLIIVQAPPAQFVQQKRGASPDSSKVRYFKKLLLCSSACRL